MKKSLGPGTTIYTHPVLIIGTYCADGRPNIMAASWGGICCSKPPCVAVSLRKATLTYGNIKAAGAFTVNVPSESQVVAADYAGMASGRAADKFKAAGLTPVKSELVNAPYIGEFPFVLECRLIRETEIGLHTQFIGEILDMKAEESVLGPGGQPLMEKIRPFVYASGGDGAYFGIGRKLASVFSAGKELMK